MGLLLVKVFQQNGNVNSEEGRNVEKEKNNKLKFESFVHTRLEQISHGVKIKDLKA